MNVVVFEEPLHFLYQASHRFCNRLVVQFLFWSLRGSKELSFVLLTLTLTLTSINQNGALGRDRRIHTFQRKLSNPSHPMSVN